jgi:nucleoside-diphosphate-sugar epimerase
MKILITGGCGYIARVLTAELEERQHQIVLLDRQDPNEATVFTPTGQRVPKPLETHWPLVKAEITDPVAMRKATEGVDAVVHLAAIVTGFPEQGVQTFTVNALGTFVVLDAARQSGVRRFFCASSINTFGTFYWRLSGKPVVYTKLPLDESFPPVPEDPYSLSKWVNELTCDTFHRGYGITTAAFRFAGVWDDQLFEETKEKGLQPTKAWSDELYQWVHVRDLARGIRQALEKEELPGCGVYTLGAGDTRCPEPTMEILQRFRPDLAKTLDAPIAGRDPLLSIDRARRTFGYAPRFRLGP